MQTERDTHTERDTLLQEETHTPESKTHTHTHSEGIRGVPGGKELMELYCSLILGLGKLCTG